MKSSQLVFLLITISFGCGKNVTWSSMDLQLASTSSCIVATALLKKILLALNLSNCFEIVTLLNSCKTDWWTCVPNWLKKFSSELEFGHVGFEGEGKTVVPGGKPFEAERRTNSKLR